jgi:hypothetical protein
LLAERRSKVTFDIEPAGAAFKLTVVHDDFEPGSTVAEMISEGWPALLSDLKSLLATARPFRAKPSRRRDQRVTGTRRSPASSR